MLNGYSGRLYVADRCLDISSAVNTLLVTLFWRCLEKGLVIEVDGGQHQASQVSDDERTEKLVGAGFSVLRFWNNEVIGQLEAVKEKIWLELQKTGEPHPHLNPLPEGEETILILLPPLQGEGRGGDG